VVGLAEPGTRLAGALASTEFVVTTDLLPPRSGHPGGVVSFAEILRSAPFTAVNVADMPSARLSQAPLAAARLLIEAGVEPILQLTCRDRNRLALQSDLLAAHALGTRNVLCLTGDHPVGGDHPDAKPVFDLSATELLAAVTALNRGHSLGGSVLDAGTGFFAGAALHPGQRPLEPQLARARAKERAGARFFQTQPLFVPEQGETFLETAAQAGIEAPLLLGSFLLESAPAADFFNQRVPGVDVPVEVRRGLADAGDPAAYGRTMVGDFLQWALESHARSGRPAGLHLMSANRHTDLAKVVGDAGALTNASRRPEAVDPGC
jgi:5,10-methylenetetrahydrofolate reductase